MGAPWAVARLVVDTATSTMVAHENPMPFVFPDLQLIIAMAGSRNGSAQC